MSHAAADRYAWTEPAVEDLGGGIYRIPLPLPLDGLKAVNVYAITDPGGVDLIDAGMAIVAARERLTQALRQLGYGLGDVRNFLVTHIHLHHDAASEIMFAGDHVLPHITPSIGFEPAGNRMALRDYLGSLARTLALPEARLLPAHGPVCDSTHERVHELLAHHDARLAETLDAVRAGHATAFEVAKAIKWTRRQRLFDDLDLFAQIQAVNETAAHLEVLLVRGQVTRETSPVGADLYQVPDGTGGASRG